MITEFVEFGKFDAVGACLVILLEQLEYLRLLVLETQSPQCNLTLEMKYVANLEFVKVQGAVLVHIKDFKGFTDFGLLLVAQFHANGAASVQGSQVLLWLLLLLQLSVIVGVVRLLLGKGICLRDALGGTKGVAGIHLSLLWEKGLKGL